MNTFEERHAATLEDPLAELKRRLQPWASAPDSRGQPLNSVIVPRSTVEDTVLLLEQFYEIIETFKKAPTKGRA